MFADDARVCVCVCAHSDMKNAVIGNNKQKANLIVLGAVPRYVSAHLPLINGFSSLSLESTAGLFDHVRDNCCITVAHNPGPFHTLPTYIYILYPISHNIMTTYRLESEQFVLRVDAGKGFERQ